VSSTPSLPILNCQPRASHLAGDEARQWRRRLAAARAGAPAGRLRRPRAGGATLALLPFAGEVAGARWQFKIGNDGVLDTGARSAVTVGAQQLSARS